MVRQLSHNLTLSVLFFFCCQMCLAQKTSYSIIDTEQSKKYARMAVDTVKVDVPKAKEYALKSFWFAKKCESDSLLLRSTKTLGIIYKMLENIDSSQYYSQLGINYADRISDNRTAAVLTSLVARTYVEYGEYNKAYELFEKAEGRFEVLNQDSIDPTFFFFKLNKSSLFNELTLYDLMLKELFEAQKIADSISDDNFSGQILASIAVGYKKSNDLEKSIEYNKKSLKYFREGEIDQAITFTNIGNNFSDLRMIDSALYYYDKARNIYASKNASQVSFHKLDIAQAQMYFDNEFLRETSNLLSKIDTNVLGTKQKAKVCLLKSKVSKERSDKLRYAQQALVYALRASDILIQKESYYILYQQQKSGENLKEALRNYECYQVLEDSIFNREKSKAIQKVILQRTIDEKNTEIRLNELQFKKDKAEKDRTILFVLLALVIILFILGLFYFRYRSQKQKTKIEIQSKELLQKENHGIKSELVNLVFETDRNFQVLKDVKEKLKEIKKSSDMENQMNSLVALLNRFVASETEKRKYQDRVNEVKEDFFEKLGHDIKLTKTEKKMAALLKLDLSTKEIATLLNVMDTTIEVYRSRIRKKLKIDKEQELSDFFNSL